MSETRAQYIRLRVSDAEIHFLPVVLSRDMYQALETR